MTDENGERLYSTAEIAGMLDCNRVTVFLRAEKLRSMGCKVGRKVGRVWAFTAAEVEAVRNAPDRRRREHRQRDAGDQGSSATS